SFLVTDGPDQRLPQRDRDILDRVMGVDIHVTTRLHAQIEEGMSAERGQHVVVEPNSCRDIGPSTAVHQKIDRHVALARLALDLCKSAHGAASSRRTTSRAVKAERKAAMSSGVPTETRSQPASCVSRISTP